MTNERITHMPNVNPEDAQRLNAALCERLQLDPGRISSSGFRVDWTGSDDDVTIRWDGIATMPLEEFRELFNGLGIQRAD